MMSLRQFFCYLGIIYFSSFSIKINVYNSSCIEPNLFIPVLIPYTPHKCCADQMHT